MKKIPDKDTKTWHANPKSQRVALSGPDKEKWIESMQVELGSIRWRGAWERVEYTPTDCFPLPRKFLHELKISSDGNVAQWKSRLVAYSNMSKEGYHYGSDEISSSIFFMEVHGLLLVLRQRVTWRWQLSVSGPHFRILI